MTSTRTVTQVHFHIVRVFLLILGILAGSLLLAASRCYADGDSDLVARALIVNTRDLISLRDYIFVKQTQLLEFDKNNQITKSSTQKQEIFFLDGAPYQRLIEIDGHPLSDTQRLKQEQTIDTAIKDAKTAASQKPKDERDRKAAKTIADALSIREDIIHGFIFTRVAEEQRAGHLCVKLSAEPKPGFKGRSSLHALLRIVHGYIWIDKDTEQWVDIEATLIKKLGGGPVCVGENSAIYLHQDPVRDGLWVLTKEDVRLDARLLLVRKNVRVVKTYSDFRKLSSSVRILSEAEPADLSKTEDKQ